MIRLRWSAPSPLSMTARPLTLGRQNAESGPHPEGQEPLSGLAEDQGAYTQTFSLYDWPARNPSDQTTGPEPPVAVVALM